MKKIKNKCLLTTPPSKSTIDFVIGNISPLLIKNKLEAVYFLTVLGDSVLGKSCNKINYIHPCSKNFLIYIKNHSVLFFKSPLKFNKNLKSKYLFDDNKPSTIRIIRIKNAIMNKNNWFYFIRDHFIDFIVVACYFSNINQSAEHYFEKIKNEKILKTMGFLQNKSNIKLVEEFANNLDKHLCPHHTQNYNFKDIQYLWSLFLDKYYLDHKIVKFTILNNGLRGLLKTNKKKEFVNIKSSILENIYEFKSFWKHSMVYDYESYYELEEIKTMFDLWLSLKIEETPKENSKEKRKINSFSVYTINNILHHYYENEIKLKDGKIFHKKCKLWDKNNDIELTLREYIGNLLKSGEIKNENKELFFKNISYEKCEKIFDFYKKYTKEKSFLFLVKKDYFCSYILSKNITLPNEFEL